MKPDETKKCKQIRQATGFIISEIAHSRRFKVLIGMFVLSAQFNLIFKVNV